MGSEKESRAMREICVDMMMNESNLIRFSEIFQKYYGWYNKGSIIVHPYVFGERFKPINPFNERKAMAFSTGTITYKETSEFLAVYGDSCDQPSRKQIKDNAEEAKTVKPQNKLRFDRLYQALHITMPMAGEVDASYMPSEAVISHSFDSGVMPKAFRIIRSVLVRKFGLCNANLINYLEI